MPVVVYIHGGGCVLSLFCKRTGIPTLIFLTRYEAGTESWFSGVDLIVDAGGGVVAVAIQYRLGIFGFLAGKEMQAKGALNIGLRESYLALATNCD